MCIRDRSVIADLLTIANSEIGDSGAVNSGAISLNRTLIAGINQETNGRLTIFRTVLSSFNASSCWIKTLEFTDATVRGNLIIEDNTIRNFDLSGRTKLRGISIVRSQGTSISVDYERVELSRQPSRFQAPLEFYAGLERLKKNAPL